MAKTVALLLTLWLALPLKGQTYMLEAERFQYVGGWKVEKDVEAFNKAVDRKSVVYGKSVYIGGRRIIKKKFLGGGVREL